MRVETIQSGPLAVNTYLITDEKSGEMAIIDPGQNNRALQKRLVDCADRVKLILFTHGHFDHSADAALCKTLCKEAKLVIHAADAPMLYDDGASLFLPLAGGHSAPAYADRTVDEGDVLTLGEDTKLHILHTPGHSEGGITIRAEDKLFTGDTLFYHSIGRTDFPGGDIDTLIHSVKKLFVLPGEYEVLPGHEGKTDLSDERKNNPFIITTIGEKS